MYIRVGRGTYDESRADQIDRVLDAEYLPALKKTSGIRAFMSGRANGRWVSVMLWDTPEQADVLATLR